MTEVDPLLEAVRAGLRYVAAQLERAAAVASEAAKRHPEREFYRGYEQGLKDARHHWAREWLKTREANRGR